MANWEAAVTLAASAAAASNGTGSTVDLGATSRLLRLVHECTAASGDGRELQVHIETSPDGLGGWRFLGTFAKTTGGASERITLVSPDRFVRASWRLVGTSFTFSVLGYAGISYANVAQLEAFGVARQALSKISASEKSEALAAATEVASGYLASRWEMPLTAWGTDLSQVTCKLATFELIATRGFNIEGSDEVIRTRYEDAIRWLEKVSSGAITPVGIEDSATTDDPSEGMGAEVVTHADRQWR